MSSRYHPFGSGKVSMSNQIPYNSKVTMSDRRKISVLHKPCSYFILDRLCKCPGFYECNSPNCFPHRREEVMNYQQIVLMTTIKHILPSDRKCLAKQGAQNVSQTYSFSLIILKRHDSFHFDRSCPRGIGARLGAPRDEGTVISRLPRQQINTRYTNYICARKEV